MVVATAFAGMTSQLIIHFNHTHTHIHTHPFNGPFSRTTQVSRHQKVKPTWILLKQETESGSGISLAICKSAPRSRQITMPVPHHSVFYMPDALPAAQLTMSKHWRQLKITHELKFFVHHNDVLGLVDTFNFHNHFSLVFCKEQCPCACRQGTPRMAWMDNIKTWTGLPVEESIRMTEDRDKWRKYVHGVANPWIKDG